MLRSGPYPAALKRRVGGDWGHLANVQSLQLLANADLDRLQWLVVAHVSEQNNSRACVEALLESELPDLLPRTRWADQDTGFEKEGLGNFHQLSLSGAWLTKTNFSPSAWAGQ